MLINYTDAELDELARIMRSEALSDGDLAMLMVGNVVVNRVLANCLTFKYITSVDDAINQPNQFVGTSSSLYQAKSTSYEKELAKRILKGEYYYPATNALWFYAPKTGQTCVSTWYNQDLTGRYKTHCFYEPDPGVCNKLH
jgi:N-acetylmuramoyl-L-alanine amidase